MSETAASTAGSEIVYENLRRRILKLELKPGSELDEGVVSAWYQVSRTPVREALIRLTGEGLVSSRRGRGARVAVLDLQNLRDFFEGIDVLQRVISRLAATRRLRSDLSAIESGMLAFEAGAAVPDSEAMAEANYAFHDAIGEAAQSSHLAAAYRRSLVESLRIGFVCFSDHSGIDERLETHLHTTMGDHRELFAAIEARDPDLAEAVAGRHVELFRNRIATTLMSTDLTRRLSTRVLGE